MYIKTKPKLPLKRYNSCPGQPPAGWRGCPRNPGGDLEPALLDQDADHDQTDQAGGQEDRLGSLQRWWRGRRCHIIDLQAIKAFIFLEMISRSGTRTCQLPVWGGTTIWASLSRSTSQRRWSTISRSTLSYIMLIQRRPGHRSSNYSRPLDLFLYFIGYQQ